jgi:hypothetical protein
LIGMRPFVAAAGLIFASIFAVHVARVAVEGNGPLHEPVFIATSVLSLGIAAWSAILLRRNRRDD